MKPWSWQARGFSAGLNMSGVFLKDMQLAQFDRVIRSDLYGPFLTCRELVRRLEAKRMGGRIVNISSLAALMPPHNRPDYAAAKAAMITMTASLAKAVAMDGITANTVSPGTIHSVSLDEAFRKVAVNQGLAANAPWREIEQTVLPMFAQVPMGRVGTLDEIADAISFLVSPRASYITGANLRLDGGMWPGV